MKNELIDRVSDRVSSSVDSVLSRLSKVEPEKKVLDKTQILNRFLAMSDEQLRATRLKQGEEVYGQLLADVRRFLAEGY